MNTQQYTIWHGEIATFEQIVDEMAGLIFHIMQMWVPAYILDDCMQGVWIALWNRLARDPDYIQRVPRSRSVLAEWLVLDGRQQIGGWSRNERSYHRRTLTETDLAMHSRFDNPDDDSSNTPLENLLAGFSGYTRDWVELCDLRMDIGAAIENVLSLVDPSEWLVFSAIIACLLFDIPFIEVQHVFGITAKQLALRTRLCRRLLQNELRSYIEQ